MAENQQNTPQTEKKGMFQSMFGNFVTRNLWRRGRLSPTAIRNYFSKEIGINQDLLGKLSLIEKEFTKVDSMIKNGGDIANVYAELGIYADNLDSISVEIGAFQDGTGLKKTNGRFVLDFIPINQGEPEEEKLLVFGKSINQIEDTWKNLTTGLGQQMGGQITPFSNALKDLIEDIREQERKYLEELRAIKGKPDQLRNVRTELDRIRRFCNEYVRFKHYYKIPLQNAVIGNKIVSFDQVHPNFKRSWEVASRLDENGYPLEIDDNGRVLLDVWMKEIAENDWQVHIINQKPGGSEFLQKCKEVISTGVRVVDKDFRPKHSNLDVLETAAYLFKELNNIRDDLRDGRFHKHSKTTTDYIIYAEGGFDAGPSQHTKTYLTYEAKSIKLNFDSHDERYMVVARAPDFDQGVPGDELKVTREYSTPGYSGIRSPHDLNPAFDRRATNDKGLFLHWGKMLYYEDTEGINRWSENPFPCISTRGIAKFLLYWLAVKSESYSEAVESAENDVGYDIGPRDMGKPFNKNPFRGMT